MKPSGQGGPMRICAIAYHETVAMGRLEKYFEGKNGRFAGSSAAKCEQCNLAFAVVLPTRDDPDNPKYVTRLTQVITEDCINGIHKDEYLLEKPIAS
jgi:hypothetical protein